MRDRKKNEEELQIQLELPDDLARELERRARAENTTVEELLQRFIQQSLSSDMTKRIKYH